jgi:hypothetical protein
LMDAVVSNCHIVHICIWTIDITWHYSALDTLINIRTCIQNIVLKENGYDYIVSKHTFAGVCILETQ